ncbi:hypothetical protein KIN20_017194 [Parelaphostrongylus tenuis]|uniref:Uncharacterized protein n=1 Tax=Parelaphostrongylus tenuis TaxID=148309 RepID=A0AAD5QRB9_PARTN|nr:hypothetical protein KIN20_017194 [Parelaphostrongylus tenuis]
MLRIARELSESDSGVFAILEDVGGDSDAADKPQRRRRSIGVQTEISCNDAPLSTDVSIRIRLDDQQQQPSSAKIRTEEITKMRELIAKNIVERQALDKKHNELYSRLEEILNVSDPDDDSKSSDLPE